MCGRFSETSSAEKIAGAFRVDKRTVPPRQNRFNITPGQPVLTLINDFGKKRFDYLNWGLIPSWSKDLTARKPLINARAETVFEKPSFRSLIKNSRCLIIADGYYEWRKTASGSQPYYIKMKTGETFGFGGVHTSWISSEGSEIHSCAIITTAAGDRMRDIHHRMPLILTSGQADSWLDKNIIRQNLIEPLITAAPDDCLEMYPVSTFVNAPEHDSEECRMPVARTEQKFPGSLFG